MDQTVSKQPYCIQHSAAKTTEPTQIDQLLAKHPTKLEQGIKTF